MHLQTSACISHSNKQVDGTIYVQLDMYKRTLSHTCNVDVHGNGVHYNTYTIYFIGIRQCKR